MSTQTSKAGVGTTGSFNMLHGHGSMLGEVGGGEMPWKIEKREDKYCVIKESDGSTEKCHDTEAEAKAHLRALYASEDKEVAEKAGSASDYLVVEDPEKPSTWHLPVKKNGKPDHRLMGAAWAALHGGYRGNKYEGPKKAEAIRKLTALYKSEGIPVPGGKSTGEHLFVYKSDDGSYRWASISNVAIKDKEFEIVTEKAYDDAIEHAQQTGDFGELDLVHVPGTDVGTCDFMARRGNQLLEGGAFNDSNLVPGVIKAINEDPDYWGVSIKFVYDPSKFDGEKYHGNIRIQKRSILPQEMAASFGTRLVAMNGGVSMEKEMSDKTRAALEKLEVPEEEIEALAEKQKQAEPEPNTVEKEAGEEAVEEVAEQVEVTEETVEVKQSVWKRFADAVSNLVAGTEGEPDAETGSEEEKEVEPVEAPGFTADDMQKLAEAISKPLIEKIAELDARLGAYEERLGTQEKRLDEAEQAVEDKVINKLVDLPQVVKVRASEVDATVAEEQPTGGVLPTGQPSGDYVSELMKGVTAAVNQGIRDALPKVQI